MWRFVKWTLLGVLGLVVLAAGYGTYVVFINPSLHMTVNKQTFALLMDDPELITQLGAIEGGWLDFHSGKLSDASWEQGERDQQRLADNLAVIEAYEPASLEGQEKITREVMIWFYGTALAYRDVAWATGGAPYPVNQMFGVQNGFPRFMQFTHVVRNEKTARNYVERLKAVGVKFDQVIGVVRKQAGMGDVPPTFVIKRHGLDFVRILDTQGKRFDSVVQVGQTVPTEGRPAEIEILSGLKSGDTIAPAGAAQ